MPRQRTARTAVLGAAVPRTRPGSYSFRSANALRRRLVAGGLVLLSIVLITIYFRESAGGALHRVQSAGSTVLYPFEVAANRVARPFRDAYSYTSGLVHAKSENRRLRSELDAARQQLIQNNTAAQQNTELMAKLHYVRGPTFPKGYRFVAADVTSRPDINFGQQIVVAAGTSSGIRQGDPVVTQDGLAGVVTLVAGHAAAVTLLTDETSAVSARDAASAAPGIVQHAQGGNGKLTLNRVTKDLVVNRGDTIVTAGWRAGKLSSLYPKNIPIGKVVSVGQSDVDLYKQIQVQPFVNFSTLDSVLVLVPIKPGRP
ncbi:MAG: rod shape-determining protein MreC [Gaiellaceae bacterium]